MFDFLSQKFSSLFSRPGDVKKLTEETIQSTLVQVQDALLEADVPYKVVEACTTCLKGESVGQKIGGSLQAAEQVLNIVQQKVMSFLGGDSSQLAVSCPSV